MLLPHLSEYKLFGLDELDDRALKKQARSFQEVYSTVLTTKVNDCRNNAQQSIRKALLEEYKKGNIITAAKLLHVVKRTPEVLQLLPEKNANGSRINKNITANKNTKKYRDRLFFYADVLLVAILAANAWGHFHRSHNTLQKRKVDVGGIKVPVVTAGIEALVIILLENAEKKWIFEAEMEKRKGRKIKPADRKEDWYKNNAPKVQYSTKSAGHIKYGGWNKAGRLRFSKIRSLIEKGRALDTTEAIEEDLRKALYRKHMVGRTTQQEAPIKQPKLDLRGAAVGAGGDGNDVSDEEYDSDEEDKQAVNLGAIATKAQEEKKAAAEAKKAAAEAANSAAPPAAAAAGKNGGGD